MDDGLDTAKMEINYRNVVSRLLELIFFSLIKVKKKLEHFGNIFLELFVYKKLLLHCIASVGFVGKFGPVFVLLLLVMLHK